MLRRLLPLVLCGWCVACPPKPSPQLTPGPSAEPGPPAPAPTPAPAPVADECSAACSTLAALGCPEGTPDAGQSCVDVCRHTQATHLTDLHPVCLAGAKTKEQARACGSVKCPSAP